MHLLKDNSIYNITNLYVIHTLMVMSDGEKRQAFFGEWLAGNHPLLLEDIIKQCSGSLLTTFQCRGTLIPLDELSKEELEELAASNRPSYERLSIDVHGGDPSPETSFRHLRSLYETKAKELEERLR